MSGSVFLFDVSNACRARTANRSGVELRAQKGEVGAVDWAEGVLASCADDGTTRIWRPNVDRYKECLREEEEARGGTE